MPHADLATLLLQEGALTQEALQRAQQRQQADGGSLASALLEERLLGEPALLATLHRLHGLPIADPREFESPESALRQSCPLVVAQSYRMVPYKQDGSTLWVVVDEPIEARALEKLSQRLRLTIRPCLALEPRLLRAMARLYGTDMSPRLVALAQHLDEAAAARAGSDTQRQPPLTPLTPLTPEPAPPEGLAATAAGDDAPAPGGGHQQTAEPAATLKRVRDGLLQTEDRDAIVGMMLEATAAVFEFAALLRVQRQRVRGWRSLEATLTERIAGLDLSVALPSVLQTVYVTHAHYLGPLQGNSADLQLLDGLGRASPRTAFLAPIRIGGRLAAMLYADNGLAPVPHQRVTALVMLANIAAVKLEAWVRSHRATSRMAGDVALVEGVRPRDLESHQARPTSPDDGEEEKEEVGLEDDATLWAQIVFEPEPQISDAAVPTPGATPSGALRDATGDYVAFAEVHDDGSLDEWEDVLYDTTLADEAEARAAAATAADRDRRAQPPHVGWNDVLSALETTRLLEPLPPTELAAPPAQQAPAQQAPAPMPPMPQGQAAALAILAQADAVDRWPAAVADLQRCGADLEGILQENFPGATVFDPFARNTRLPAFGDCSGMAALAAAAAGPGIADVMARHLDSQQAVTRFFAIYYHLAHPFPPACEALARRLYDTQPQNRSLAAEALRRYAAVPAYREVRSSLREQLAVSAVETRVTTAMVLGQLREPSAVASLIPLVADDDARVANVASSALAVICAQAFGNDLHAWQQWWRDNCNTSRAEWLVASLEHPQPVIRRLAHNELKQLTAAQIRFDPEASPQERQQGVQAWRQWLVTRRRSA